MHVRKYGIVMLGVLLVERSNALTISICFELNQTERSAVQILAMVTHFSVNFHFFCSLDCRDPITFALSSMGPGGLRFKSRPWLQIFFC